MHFEECFKRIYEIIIILDIFQSLPTPAAAGDVSGAGTHELGPGQSAADVGGVVAARAGGRRPRPPQKPQPAAHHQGHREGEGQAAEQVRAQRHDLQLAAHPGGLGARPAPRPRQQLTQRRPDGPGRERVRSERRIRIRTLRVARYFTRVGLINAIFVTGKVGLEKLNVDEMAILTSPAENVQAY
jgi:hypothetical protein